MRSGANDKYPRSNRVWTSEQQEPIVDAVAAALAHGADVSGLEDREDLLPGESASSLVGVGDEHAERSLSQALFDQHRIPIDRAGLGVRRNAGQLQPFLNRVRELSTDPRSQVIRLPLLGRLLEVAGGWDP